MKKTLLSLILLAFTGLSMNSQTQLWGTSYSGGANGQGTIFSADASGTNFQIAYDFVNATGAMPTGGMCLANNGKYYGVTEEGGWGNSCCSFNFDPSTRTYTDIYDFYQYTQYGWHAFSKLLKANSGMLYGLAGLGGANGGGVIYRIDPTNDTYTDVYDFDITNGSNANGSLIQGSDGKLYGMTQAGGANAEGVIFSFDPAIANYTKLYVFNSATGSSPSYGGLLQANDGKLYGMTQMGGANGLGVLFSFNLSNGDYTDLYDFNAANGSSPNGSVIQATDGKLYGMTSAGGSNNLGVIFSYDITLNSYSNLVNFNGTNGASPRRSLFQASNGKLYGTTNAGGATSEGVAFSYDITSTTYTKLIDFSSLTTGANPDCEFAESPMSVSVNNLNAKSELNIYPNPANNYITIANGNKDEIVQFTDILGRELATVKTIALGKTTLDISTYPSVFFAKMQSGAVKKIVKK